MATKELHLLAWEQTFSNYLCEWDTTMSPDEVLEAIMNNDDSVLVWEPFENWSADAFIGTLHTAQMSLHSLLKDVDQEARRNGMAPCGANAVIRWVGTDDEENVYISFGDPVEDEDGDIVGDSFGIKDNEIFFYGDPDEEQNYRNGTEGWTLISWEPVFLDEV